MIDFKLRFAFENVKERRLRSILTIIGIAIGIAAVVSLISLGQGLKVAINEQFERMGSNVITVMASSGGVSTPMMGLMSKNPITKNDEKVILSVRGVEDVGASIFVPDTVEAHGRNIDTFVSGITINEFDYMLGRKGYKIIEGRKLLPTDKYAAIIGYSLYTGDYEKNGKRVRLRDKIIIQGREFRVVGVLDKIGSDMDDKSIMIPMKTFREVYDEPEKDGMIFVHVKDGFDVEKVAEDIKHALRRTRNEKEGEETFQVQTSKGMLEAFNTILTILNAVLIGIASISLLVGGVGIMNTMYTSTLERTREIGILKSIGARRFDIMMIFLYESAILGMIGGIFGLLFGFGLGKFAETIALYYGVTLRVYFSPILIVGSLVFSMFVGILSGVAPAIQASRLNPVDALRYE